MRLATRQHETCLDGLAIAGSADVMSVFSDPGGDAR
jgi:hypothetical protein